MPTEPSATALTIYVDGAPVDAFAGQSVASALLGAGLRRLRHSPAGGTPRGAFCLMGACQECAIRIDGVIKRGCVVRVVDGMKVERIGVPGAGGT